MRASAQKPIITLHYNVVRNAWRGPETFYTVDYHGERYIQVRAELAWSPVPRYLPLGYDPLTDTRGYAVWYIWPLAALAKVTGGTFWAALRWGYRRGIIDTKAEPHPGEQTRLRDLRLRRKR